jgi:hypothetical protein
LQYSAKYGKGKETGFVDLRGRLAARRRRA